MGLPASLPPCCDPCSLLPPYLLHPSSSFFILLHPSSSFFFLLLPSSSFFFLLLPSFFSYVCLDLASFLSHHRHHGLFLFFHCSNSPPVRSIIFSTIFSPSALLFSSPPLLLSLSLSL